ncbi:MAG: hypothetical protein O3C21_09155, partial [Verrucomicrobia bacterium]|nr:hypothetical protein [Verrucomicrobiota bacterium]
MKHPRLRRWGRRLSVLALLAVCFYSIEYWRGGRKWTAFRAEWEAKGENFDQPEVPEIPDDQNAAKTPLMRELTEIWRAHPQRFLHPQKLTEPDRGRLYELGSLLRLKTTRENRSRISGCRLSELAGIQWVHDGRFLPDDESEAALEIIAKFNEHAAPLAEIDAMLALPALATPSVDPDDFEATTPPHADRLFRLVQPFGFRARAEIQLGNGAAARADIERCLAIARLLLSDRGPSKMGLYLGTSSLNLTLPRIWEGIFSQVWNAEELERLHLGIERIDHPTTFMEAMRSHRAFDIEAATSFRKRLRYNAGIEHRNNGAESFGQKNLAPSIGYPFYEPLRPQGWRYAALSDRLSNWQRAFFTKADGTVNF